jgi:hypothetical protein
MRAQTTQPKRQKNNQNHVTKASEGNLGTRTRAPFLAYSVLLSSGLLFLSASPLKPSK